MPSCPWFPLFPSNYGEAVKFINWITARRVSAMPGMELKVKRAGSDVSRIPLERKSRNQALPWNKNRKNTCTFKHIFLGSLSNLYLQPVDCSNSGC